MFLVSTKVESTRQQRPAVSPYIISLLVFIFFAVVFLCLRSQQYLAVDGVLRCLEIYRRNQLVFYTNNHLWYQANIFFWSHALEWLGLKAHTPFEFISLSQAMNAVAAAGSLAAVYLLLRLATSSAAVSIAAVLAYGFSRAMLLHATNSAEPTMGFFYSAVAMVLAVEALRREKKWLLIFAGASLGMAMASYQSMVLIAPLAVLLCFGWPFDGGGSLIKVRLLRWGALLLGAFVSVCAAYGWAYSQSGSRTVAAMVRRFFELQGGNQVYGYLSVSKLINPPFGLVFSLLPLRPPDYVGVRSLLKEHNFFWIGSILISLICLFLIARLLARPLIANWKRVTRSDRLLVIALIASFGILIGPLIYWDPLYDKLWLQPLAIIISLAAVLYRIGVVPVRRRAAAVIVTCFIALEIAANLSVAAWDHRTPTQGISEARIVADLVKPNDFIVLNFDGLSMLYLTLWGSADNSLLLPASTEELATERMTEAIRKAHETGGNIYFLSVFDISEPAWTAFLGNRVGIPYHSFDKFRTNSTLVRSFEFEGHTTTLRKLN
jgi:hypothetical protein